MPTTPHPSLSHPLARCGHCGGVVLRDWDGPTCLQCGRSPNPEEVPAWLLEELRDGKSPNIRAHSYGVRL